MPTTPAHRRARRSRFIRQFRRHILTVAAAGLSSTAAFADAGPSGDDPAVAAMPGLPVPTPLAASPLHAISPALASPFAWCDRATRNCTEIAAIDWRLAGLHNAQPPADETAPAAAASLIGGPYTQQDEGTGPEPAKLAGNTQGPPARWTDHATPEQSEYRGFFKQSGTITTELLLLTAYFAAQSGKKLFKPTSGFNFNSEKWFGKDTSNVGVDKLTHAFDTYLLAEVIHMRLHKTTHASAGDALNASIWAATFMALNEISDGIEPDHGYSMEDIAMNVAGAIFSLMRNTIPGLKEKVAFKIEIVPDDNIYSYQGKEHFEQQRFMFSIKGAGFKPLQSTPLRFLDFQVGYYASDFLEEDRAAGVIPQRHLFVGVGLNVGELLFGRSRSKVGRIGYTILDYLQLPYTSLRVDTKAM